MQKLAFYDQLTELPNRTLFYDRIIQRVAQAKRDKQKLALMFLDLDDFKIINDTFGQAGATYLFQHNKYRYRPLPGLRPRRSGTHKMC